MNIEAKKFDIFEMETCLTNLLRSEFSEANTSEMEFFAEFLGSTEATETLSLLLKKFSDMSYWGFSSFEDFENFLDEAHYRFARITHSEKGRVSHIANFIDSLAMAVDRTFKQRFLDEDMEDEASVNFREADNIIVGARVRTNLLRLTAISKSLLLEAPSMPADELEGAISVIFQELLEVVRINGLSFDLKIPDVPEDFSLDDISGDTDLWRSSKIGFGNFIEASSLFDALLALRFNHKLAKFVPILNKEVLLQNAQKKGAKGANLENAILLLQSFKNVHGLRFGSILLPKFQIITSDIFDKYKGGGDIAPDVKNIYECFVGTPTILRSSAVNSEDGESTTGAGIYDSIVLKEDFSFDDFLEVVMKIFESVNSQRAVNYRGEHGIDVEKMAIVVQEYIENADPEFGNAGWMNTSMSGQSGLIDARIGNNRFVINKDKVLEVACQRRIGAVAAHISHVPVDHRRHYDPADWNTMESLSMFTLILEKHYGFPVQIEFGIDEEKGLHLFQVRPLPKAFLQESAINFPEEPCICYGNAAGVGDVTLDIIRNGDTYREKGVYVHFGSSAQQSIHGYEGANNFPKEGAIIITGHSGVFSGHLETLAVERGLMVIFGLIANTQDEYNETMDYLEKAERLRIVSNGLEGRIYKAE